MFISDTSRSRSDSQRNAYAFGAFVLDLDRGMLTKNGTDLSLRPKSLEVLSCLVTHAGALVTKAELMAAVWPDVVVTDDSLVQCLIEIRKTLGDHDKTVIRTLPRKGYLFDIPVTRLEDHSSPFTAKPQLAINHFGPTRPRLMAAWPMAVFATVVLVWFLVTSAATSKPSPGSSQANRSASSDVTSEPDQLHNPAAAQYQQGKYHYARRAPGDLDRAMKYFQQAAELEPEWAEPWAGMGSTLHLLTIGDVQASTDNTARIIELMEKALSLDPNQPEALIRLACYYWLDGQVARSREFYEKALIFGQNNALVLAIAAGYAYRNLEISNALELQQRSVSLDPLNFAQRLNLGNLYYLNGQFALAKDEYLHAADLNPERQDAISGPLLTIAILLRDYTEAYRLLQQMPDGPEREHGAALYALSKGDETTAEASLQRLSQYVDADSLVLRAEVLAFSGQAEEAIQAIQEATRIILHEHSYMAATQLLNQIFLSPWLQNVMQHPDASSWRRSVVARASPVTGQINTSAY